RLIGDSPRTRGAVEQAALALEPVPARPLARAADADTGGLGRRLQRPTLDDHPLGQPPAATPTERRVTVKLHPDLLLGAESAWQPSASKEARMDQPAQELHLGGFGGTVLVVRTRWSFAGKDAGSVNSRSYWRDCVTRADAGAS